MAQVQPQPLILALLLAAACASDGRERPSPMPSGEGASGSAGQSGGSAPIGGGRGGASGTTPPIPLDAAPPCSGLRCQQTTCQAGEQTTLSGVAYAPNGVLPLYNVIAYVPNAELEPFGDELTCNQCGALTSGSPIVTALSDDQGRFELVDVPVGENIPLVLQVGKWRRKVIVPEVQPCVDNVLSDPELTRLPKNQSEGDMPRMAVALGGCESVACMLPKVGIDPSEFGLAGEGKAVSFYGGSEVGGVFAQSQAARTLWSDFNALKQYDMTIFSCECNETANTDEAAFSAVQSYLDAGGRIFTTDFQYVWYKFSPDMNMRATAAYPGGAPPGGSPLMLDTSFPKGQALANWLHHVEPTSTYGEVRLDAVFANLGDVMPASVQVWASSGGFAVPFPGFPSGAAGPRFITVNTPVGKPANAQCGKAVHLDAHINNMDLITGDFPASCSAPMSQGEKAFAFFFFDLASCIQEEDDPPVPPPPVVE